MAGSTSGISPSFLGLSRSSGQVTHVLLTRSRLCPRPKPGSSLHLHVLSTPPAFVLSQDQTLREELLRGLQMNPPKTGRKRPGSQRVVSAHTREPRYTAGSGARTGLVLGTADSHRPQGSNEATAYEPGHSISTEGSVEGAHAVEFSKTVAPLQEGASFPQARPRAGVRPR